MLKAFNKPMIVSPGVSVHSSQTPNNAEVEDQLRQGQAPLENGRTSLTHMDDGQVDAEDGASSAATGQPTPLFYAGVMLRGHKADLVRLFELPPSERLNGDFHCAMRKRVLLQGRMYVFDNYVCFYSAVFGFAKKRRMPMRTINAVRKKKHLGFPNSLEIETNEYKEFFTSFLSREEAFQLIMKLWNESKVRGDTDEGGRRSTDTGSLNGGQGTRDLSSPQSTSRGITGEVTSRRGAPNGAAAQHPHHPHPTAGGQRGGNGSTRGGGHGGGGQGAGGEPSLLTRNSGSVGEDNDDDEEEGASMWLMEGRPPPSVASGSRHVLHCSLPGTPRDFFGTVLADSAPFFEDFLDSQGNRRINLTTWKRHQQLGHVRDMNFTAPIKGAFGNWGVSHTACFQSQRFCLYEGEHIVFESSQTMTDIPYGDCFTVDQRWDVRRDMYADPDRPQVFFDLHVRVPFTSRCLFKGVIESGSVKQVQDTFSHFIEQLRPVLQERVARHLLTVRNPGELSPPDPSATPRLNSGVHGGMMRGTHPGGPPLSRSLQSMPSLRPFEATDGVEASLLSLRASAQAPAGPGASGAMSPMGGRGGPGGLDRAPEPSVGRLLASLGRRLAEGAGVLLEAGIDVVLNLTQCRTTPQMRFLVALVILMFLANMTCMVMYLWAPAVAPSAPPAAASASPPSPYGSGSLGSLPDLQQLSALLQGPRAEGAEGTGPVAGFWHDRLAILLQELALLQGRMEILGREVAAVMGHLAQAAAAAGGGASGGGAGPGAAAAGGPEPGPAMAAAAAGGDAGEL